MTREGQQSECNEPECVACADTEAKGGGEVKPEALPELSGDGCDGHGGVLVSGRTTATAARAKSG